MTYCAILYLLYRFEHFQEKSQRQKLCGKNLTTKNVVSCFCPLPVSHAVFSVFLCLIWYVPPNVKINADTAVSLVYDFRSI